MRRAAMLAALAFAAASSPVHAYDWTIANGSQAEIRGIYIVNVNLPNRPDLANDGTVRRGGAIRLRGLSRGLYDIRIVSTEGDDCTLRNVGVKGDLHWSISDRTLQECTTDEGPVDTTESAGPEHFPKL
jgi:hypothetical protein